MRKMFTILALYGAGIVFAYGIEIGTVQARVVSKNTTTSIVQKAASALALTPRRIDGVVVPVATANLWPIAVMIDNVPAARPQAGLGSASVVYEALAEGGIPRFLAVFAKRDMKKVGPIRSTRPYFVQLAAEYAAAFAHAGGSVDGIQMLKGLQLTNLEAIKGPRAKFFFRTRGGADTHDVFTTGALLSAAMRQTSVSQKTPTYRARLFRSSPDLKQRPRGSHGATVNLGAGSSFLINFQYDRKTNAYLRSTGGRTHVDANTRKQLSVKNVILQIVPKERVLDRKGRIALSVVGRGKAVLLQNGRSMTINWSKKKSNTRTVYADSHGNEIKFLRGKIWIVIMPKGHSYKLY